MLRTFLALELPVSVREAIILSQRKFQAQLPAASWTRPQALHVTLKFLGETPEDLIEILKLSVGETLKKISPFSVDLEGVGVFPTNQAPRILWVGVSTGKSGLQNLATEVEKAVLPFGFPLEKKPFHPHVTLARIKKNYTEFGQKLKQMQILQDSFKFGSIIVHSITLFRSELQPTGSIYTPLWELHFQQI